MRRILQSILLLWFIYICCGRDREAQGEWGGGRDSQKEKERKLEG